MIFQCWTTLPKAERLLCIDKTPLRKEIGGLRAWNPAGCLLERWDDEIESKVEEILGHEEHQSLLRDARGLGYTCSTGLFLLSRTGTDQAKPYIVCFHEKLKKAKEAVKILQENREMSMFGFEYLALEGLLVLTNDRRMEMQGAEADGWISDNHCGNNILACPTPVDSQTWGMKATMGGILKFGPQVYYGLMSAHVFFGSFDRNEETTSNSESEESASYSAKARSPNESESGSRLGVGSIVPDWPSFHAIFAVERRDGGLDTETRQHPLSGPDRHIGNTPNAGTIAADHRMFYNPSLDWMLFEITNPRFWGTNNIKLPEGNSVIPRPGYNRVRAPRGDLVVLGGPAGLQVATGIGIKSNISLPWLEGFVQAWLLACELGIVPLDRRPSLA
jgi:hypothetical protein